MKNISIKVALFSVVMILFVFNSTSTQSTEELTICSDDKPGMSNPAAIYCLDLGYNYEITKTEQGDKGICKLPDTECSAWEFLNGTCGQQYSYCAKQGYDIITKTDGQNSLTKEYAVCIKDNIEIGTVTELTGISGKATKGIKYEDTNSVESVETVAGSYPNSFDWRNYLNYNWMSPVKDQGQCGSCWSFASVGLTEAMYTIDSGMPLNKIDLAEQYLVSDCFTYGDSSCCGGYKHKALEHIRDIGIPSETDFPYVDGSSCTCPGDNCDSNCTYNTGGQCSDSTCSDLAGPVDRKINRTARLSSDPVELKNYIANNGPIAVSMGIGDSFGGYWDGDIYRCSDDSATNHAVVITGYSDIEGIWHVRNSWGTDWPNPSDGGYFKVGYGECSIKTFPYYAKYDSCNVFITEDTTLTENLDNCNKNGIIIGADNITLDCNGYSIEGPGLRSLGGIDLKGHNNVTIRNCEIRNFQYGVTVNGDDSTIENSNIHDNGFGLLISDYRTEVKNNNIYDNYFGVYIDSGNGHTIWGNTFYDNIHENENHNAYEITYGNSWDYNNVGNSWDDFHDQIGFPYYYEIGGDGDGIDNYPGMVEGYCGGLTPCECGSVLVADHIMDYDLLCPNNGIMILDDNVDLDCNGHTIQAQSTGIWWGVTISNASDISVQNCNIKYFSRGISLVAALNATINNNILYQPHEYSVYLFHSSGNTISNNTTTASLYGVGLNYSDDNNINNNQITTNNRRVGIELLDSNYNYINANRVDFNNKGIYLLTSSNNIIWDNYFSDNTTNAYLDENSNNNTWDYHGIGNYWHDLENSSSCPFAYEIPGLNINYDHYPRGPHCLDNDGDGYGSVCAYDCPSYGIDCNDSNPNINPGMPEICYNGIDDNCNGFENEGCRKTKDIIYQQRF